MLTNRYPPAFRPGEAQRARIAAKRIEAAIRRGSLNASLLTRWGRQLNTYRARADRLSLLDFLREYGAGIDVYCKPSRFDRKAA